MANKSKNLSRKEMLAVEEYESLLRKRFPNKLRKIILYGSKSRGDFKRGSDVDLLIVVSKNDKSTKREIAWLSHEPIAKYLVGLSPLVVGEKFSKNWSPLLEHIKKDGITLWTSKKVKKNT